MAIRRHPALPDPEETREAALLRRAFRLRRRGDDRGAMLLLRQAAFENEEDAKLWTLYAVQCERQGALRDAERALAHAIWLRERSGESGKARSTRALLARMTGRAA